MVGAIVTVFKSSSSSPPSYPENSPAPAQEYTPPAQESYDLPGGMERESEESEYPERGSVGGSCKSRRKRKSKRKKRSKRVCRKMK